MQETWLHALEVLIMLLLGLGVMSVIIIWYVGPHEEKKMIKHAICGFCGMTPDEKPDVQLVEGPVCHICDECNALVSQIFEDRKKALNAVNHEPGRPENS